MIAMNIERELRTTADKGDRGTKRLFQPPYGSFHNHLPRGQAMNVVYHKPIIRNWWTGKFASKLYTHTRVLALHVHIITEHASS
jgi:hypothetical protein